jgi:hypothetical protein
MAIEETERFNSVERGDAYLKVAHAVHSRTDEVPLWEGYREVAIDLQCEVTALREALKSVGGYLMTAKLKNQPEWIEFIPTIIAEADAVLDRIK